MRGKTIAAAVEDASLAAPFNEAPAECGGKRKSTWTARVRWTPSMRPPQNAGENSAPGVVRNLDDPPFNEAPAECGGKQEYTRLNRLNRSDPSMRPPQNAGENPSHATHRVSTIAASMRPPQNAGENANDLLGGVARARVLQ